MQSDLLSFEENRHNKMNLNRMKVRRKTLIRNLKIYSDRARKVNEATKQNEILLRLELLQKTFTDFKQILSDLIEQDDYDDETDAEENYEAEDEAIECIALLQSLYVTTDSHLEQATGMIGDFMSIFLRSMAI